MVEEKKLQIIKLEDANNEAAHMMGEVKSQLKEEQGITGQARERVESVRFALVFLDVKCILLM